MPNPVVPGVLRQGWEHRRRRSRSAAQEWRRKPEVWTAWFLPAKSRPAKYIDFLTCF